MKQTIEDFRDKIDWEGGILEAMIGYGLGTEGYDLPKELVDAWETVAIFLEDPEGPYEVVRSYIYD